MSNKSEYIGITIGPIVDTLLLSSSPAGLWGASYLFSYIAKSLAEKLIHDGIGEEEFVCPVLDDETKQIIQETQGVGLFHDRIIFRAKANEMEIVQKAIAWIKNKIADKFYKDFNNTNSSDEGYEKYQVFMDSYLQIHAVKASVQDEDNPILVLGPLLDALELMKSVNTKENKNYILKMLVNQEALNQNTMEDSDGENGKNYYMKSSFLTEEVVRNSTWKLLENGKVKNISDVAGNGIEGADTDKKKYQYYAFVQSDGDNLTAVLKSIQEFGKGINIHHSIRDFSKTCFTYSQKAAKTIHAYGGVTIYAGGDDLLFLAPLESGGKTIFNLVEELEGVFREEFKPYLIKDGKPSGLSVSFGAAIHHESYPLYESLKRAYMLLERAKEGKKHGLAVELMKRSGQKNGIHVKEFSENLAYQQMIQLFHEIWNLDDHFLRSLIQKFNLHEKEIKEALAKQKASAGGDSHIVHDLVENLFSNRHKSIFDKSKDYKEESLKAERKYIRDVTDLLIKLESKNEIQCLNKDKTDSLACLESIIRIMKFYQEERGDA